MVTQRDTLRSSSKSNACPSNDQKYPGLRIQCEESEGLTTGHEFPPSVLREDDNVLWRGISQTIFKLGKADRTISQFRIYESGGTEFFQIQLWPMDLAKSLIR